MYQMNLAFQQIQQKKLLSTKRNVIKELLSTNLHFRLLRFKKYVQTLKIQEKYYPRRKRRRRVSFPLRNPK